jgi:hypothetical protein
VVLCLALCNGISEIGRIASSNALLILLFLWSWQLSLNMLLNTSATTAPRWLRRRGTGAIFDGVLDQLDEVSIERCKKAELILV